MTQPTASHLSRSAHIDGCFSRAGTNRHRLVASRTHRITNREHLDVCWRPVPRLASLHTRPAPVPRPPPLTARQIEHSMSEEAQRRQRARFTLLPACAAAASQSSPKPQHTQRINSADTEPIFHRPGRGRGRFVCSVQQSAFAHQHRRHCHQKRGTLQHPPCTAHF